MKTKKIPLFYIFLLVIAIIVVVLTQIGKSILKDVLIEYEDSQYKYVAEDFFDSNFADSNVQTVAKLFSSQISEYETEEAFAEYISALIGDSDFSMQPSSAGLSDREKYVVSVGNLRFAEFYVDKTGVKTEHGFDTYEVADVLFNNNILKSYSIQIPSDYSLYVNGVPASEKYWQKDRIETESQAFMPDGVDGIIYTTYTFTNMCAEPEFKVTNSEGAETEITCNEDGIFVADVVYQNSALAEKYANYVIEATKAYACYMQKDASFGKVKGYLDPDSEFYKYVKETPTWPVITHNGYGFENEVVTDFHSYSEDVFSCRISFVHVLKYSGLEDYRDSIDITWYLRNVNGKFLIYDSYIH